jgi:hypothetical protein
VVRLAVLAVMLVLAAAILAAGNPAAARAAGVVLTVKGPSGTRSYTLQQLKSKFPAYKGYAGCVKTGFVGMEAPHPVKGVRLLDLLKKVGYKSGAVTLTATDGYELEYSSKQAHGRSVTMHKAAPPGYPKVTVPASNPLTAIIAYQDKKVGAHANDANPWRPYTSTYATDGSDGIGPLRSWWAYRKWTRPGYVQIGWSSLRMVRTVNAAR